MIGSLLAARYVAKKPWLVSGIFWALVFIAGLFMGAYLGGLAYFLLIISFFVFIAVAYFYLKVNPWPTGIIMFAVAYVIDFAIAMFIGTLGMSWIPW